MKMKLFPVLSDIINLILLYFLVIGVGSILGVGMDMAMATYDYIAIACVIICFYLLREFATSLKFFAPGNLIVFIAVIELAPDFNTGLRVGFVTFLFMVLNAHFWIEKDGNSAMSIPWPMVIAFIPLSAYASSKGCDKVVTELFYFSAIFIALEIVKFLLKNAYELSISGQLTSDMPVKDIYRNSFFAGMVVMLLCVAIMLFVRAQRLIDFLNGILVKVEYAFLYIFYHLVLFFDRKDVEMDPIEEVEPITELGVAGGVLDQILNIIGALLVLLILIGLLLLLIKGVRNFVRDYGHREKHVRKVRVYKTEFETREHIGRTEREKGSGFWTRKTNTEKVRLMYKKKMLSYLKKGLPISGSYTPGENAKQVLENAGSDIREMTSIYEKIRYNENEAEDLDVVAMKNAIKRI